LKAAQKCKIEQYLRYFFIGDFTLLHGKCTWFINKPFLNSEGTTATVNRLCRSTS